MTSYKDEIYYIENMIKIYKESKTLMKNMQYIINIRKSWGLKI